MKIYYLFIWIAFIICLFLMWFFTHRANHKERLLMIEKGIDPEEIKKKKAEFSFPWRKLAAVIIGLSVGLLIISILIAFKALDMGGNALPLAILGICGGGGMWIATNSSSGKTKD